MPSATGVSATTSTRGGAIRFRRFASRPARQTPRALPDRPAGFDHAGSRSRVFTTQYSRPPDPVHTPSGLNVANPLRRPGARRRGHRPPRAPASPSTQPPAATSSATVAASRSRFTAARRPRRLQRHQSAPWRPARASSNRGRARLELHHGRRQFNGAKGCPVEAGTFVTYSTGENQASKHAGRLHEGLLEQALADAPRSARGGSRERAGQDPVAKKKL